jgi:hypothetical protein
MSGFTGTGQLVRLAVRRDRIVGSAWVLGLFVFAYSQAASIVSLYPTPGDLDRLARTATGIGANPAVVALQGPAYDASTYGGATAWQVVTPGTLLIGLMSILLVTRHTRQEEETGRAELVSSGVVGRYAWLAASLLYVLAANLVLAMLCTIGYVSVGLPVAGSVALAAACGLNGLVLAGVAAICAQLTEYARPANGIALAVLGAAFLLRAIGDTATQLSWLSWLSPIGWAERFQPFAGERWAVLVLPAAALAFLLVLVAVLLVRRDLGGGVVATRPGPATAPAWLGSPLGLAWRLQRGALVGWTVGAAVAGLSFGVIAQDMVQFASQDPETAKMLATLGGSGSITGSACSPPATPSRSPCGCGPRRLSSGPSRCWPPRRRGSAGPAATCWWSPPGRRWCWAPVGCWPAWPTGCAPATWGARWPGCWGRRWSSSRRSGSWLPSGRRCSGWCHGWWSGPPGGSWPWSWPSPCSASRSGSTSCWSTCRRSPTCPGCPRPPSRPRPWPGCWPSPGPWPPPAWPASAAATWPAAPDLDPSRRHLGS